MPVSTAPTGSIKPGIWNVDPGLVAPEWRWAWDRAVHFPAWEGAGPVHGFGLSSITTEVAVWDGHDLTFDGTGGVLIQGGGSLEFSPPLTIVLYLTVDSSRDSTWTGYFGNDSWNRDGNGFHGVSLQHSDTNEYAFGFGDGGTGSGGITDARGGAPNFDTPVFLVGVVESAASDASGLRLFEDGVEVSLSANFSGASVVDYSADSGAIGETDNQMVGSGHFYSAFDHALTPGEIARWARDPFAPFRMGRRRVVVSADTTLTADAGSYTVSGSAADLLRSLILSGDAGSYTVSGATASLLRSKLLSADAGTYSVAGQAADLLRALLLTGDAGSYTLTGAAATLAVSGDTTLTAEAGSYSVSGSPADLLRALQMGADAGAYTTSGQSADLLRALVMAAESGTLQVTGAQADLLRDLLMDAEAGTLTLTGEAATLIATGAAIGLQAPFLMHSEGPERTMDGEGPDRRMSGEGPDRDMSGEE